MAGYTRQSVADIIANAVIKAAPVNAEFNALRDAFATSTGHKHDGTSAEGAFVPILADLDGNNKVVVDTSNNRISIFVEVGGSPVEQLRIQDGVIVPVTDNDIDLGTDSLEFKNLYIDGIAKIDTLTVDENATIAGTLGVTGISTLPTVNIDAGTIDGTVIGGASAQAITGTLVTATTGFSGTLTGNVTGNLTGNVAGNVTGNVTGDLTGNVTAASGSSSFTDVTINGTLNMNAGTTATITNLTTPVSAGDAATKGYVDTAVSNLIDSAPGTLDTLNELAAALGDDPNFATTITNSIATKLPLAGGTMSGAIAMGTSKITGLGDPTANQDAATKFYVDTQDATKLSLSGGTMTGAIDMGANKVTSTTTPTADDDLTRKAYVDSILGSATAAATSAANALTSETNAATSASNASTSETNAANSANAAAASYDSFDDRYLGAKSSAPATDNDGDPLITGALYFDTTVNLMRVYDGSAFVDAGSAVNGTSERNVYTATGGQTSFASNYDVGFVDVYLNGVKLIAGTDFTATDGLSVVLATGATAGDTVDIVAYGAFNIADTYTQAQSDARFVNVAGDTVTGALAINGNLTVDTNTLFVDAANNRVGIGVSSPATRLDVAQASRYTFDLANSYTEQTSLNAAGSAFADDFKNAAQHIWRVNGVERMRITSTGSVGIGTNSPIFPLHVVGASSADYFRPTGNQIDPNDGASYIYQKTGVGWDFASLNLSFSTGSSSARSERIRITSTGSVGIGTSSPAHTLDVAGEMIADSYNETFVTLSGTTPAVNCETGNVFALTTSGNTTFTFTNPPATGTAYGFTLKVTAGGTHTLTWPASVDWAGGTAPDAPASGETDVFVFITHDGGTTWYGFQAGDALA